MKPFTLDYTFKKFEINKDTINQFQIMERARILRKGQKNHIKNMLLDGDHFDSPIIINDKLGKMRIIDGQHRITALKEIMKQLPDFRITVLLITYKNLTSDSEKVAFKKWNSGTRQTSEDMLQIWADTIPIYKKLEEAGICSIYKQIGKFKFKNLVQPYIQAQAKNFTGISFQTFIDEAKKLKDEDFKEIKKFSEEFKEHLGELEMSNYFTNSSAFAPIAGIYFLKGLNSTEFWKKFEPLKSNEEIKKLARLGGMIATRNVQIIMENQLFGCKQKITPLKFFDHSKYTEEMRKWLKDNYEKTLTSIGDLTEKFKAKFDIETTESALKYQMKIKGIKKDPEWYNKMLESEELISKRVVYTKKVMDFIMECSKTMNLRETCNKLAIEFEHPFSLSSLQAKCVLHGIHFLRKPELNLPKCTKEQLKIIKKYRDSKTYEIRDELIGQLGHSLPEPDIRKIVRFLKKDEEPEDKFDELDEEEKVIDYVNQDEVELDD